MSTNEVRRVFNEYGRFHHTEFYNDLKIVQKMPTGHVYVNIYTNAEGSVFALDVAGNPINNRMVQYTIYTNPYYHPYDGNIEGVFKIKFVDGGVFEKKDSVDAVNPVFWYSFPAIVPNVVKPFT
jgi:hypothetical protein